MEFLSLSRRRSSMRNVPSGEERGEIKRLFSQARIFVPKSNSFRLYIPFLTEKVSFSYTKLFKLKTERIKGTTGTHGGRIVFLNKTYFQLLPNALSLTVSVDTFYVFFQVFDVDRRSIS